MREPVPAPRAALSALRVVGAALLLGLLVLGLVVVAARLVHEPVGLFTRDITTLSSEAGAELPPYTGALGLLTFMIWASAASLSALVALLNPARRTWLMLFAVFLAWLTTDDSLSVHEVIGPDLGIPERAFYLGYALAGLGLSLLVLRRVRREGLDASVLPFLLGGALLAVSVGVDQLFEGAHLAEDGPKFLGALTWLTVPLLSLPQEAFALMRHRPSPVSEQRVEDPRRPREVPVVGSRVARHGESSLARTSQSRSDAGVRGLGGDPAP